MFFKCLSKKEKKFIGIDAKKRKMKFIFQYIYLFKMLLGKSLLDFLKCNLIKFKVKTYTL